MITNILSARLRQRVGLSLILIALVISVLLVLPSCGKAAERDDAITQATLTQNSVNSETAQTTLSQNSVTSETTQAAEGSSVTGQSQTTLPSSSLSLEGYGAKGALDDKNLSMADMLTYAIQDEYLARGEYAVIIEKFGSEKPYSNIILAEEKHITSLKEIYAAYDMPLPEDTSAGHMIEPKDLLEAAKTGVQAEIDNIAMYNLFLSYELPEDIREVFNSLEKGSESHLLAFQKQVDKLS